MAKMTKSPMDTLDRRRTRITGLEAMGWRMAISKKIPYAQLSTKKLSNPPSQRRKQTRVERPGRMVTFSTEST
jgi:hypothetical protein